MMHWSKKMMWHLIVRWHCTTDTISIDGMSVTRRPTTARVRGVWIDLFLLSCVKNWSLPLNPCHFFFTLHYFYQKMLKLPLVIKVCFSPPVLSIHKTLSSLFSSLVFPFRPARFPQTRLLMSQYFPSQSDCLTSFYRNLDIESVDK